MTYIDKIYFQLSNIGIPTEQVTWNKVTMTSDRWIAIRHGTKEDSASMVTFYSVNAVFFK